MSRDPRAWRVEKFEGLGFAHNEAVALADSKDAKGVHVYWGDVEKALQAGVSEALALEIYVEHHVPTTALVIEGSE